MNEIDELGMDVVKEIRGIPDMTEYEADSFLTRMRMIKSHKKWCLNIMAPYIQEKLK